MRYSVSTTDIDRGVHDPQIGCWWMKQNITAFHGLCLVKGPGYESKVMLNPTWRQMFLIARKQQKVTGDLHHDFFEGYHDTGKDIMTAHRHPVRVLHLSLGS